MKDINTEESSSGIPAGSNPEHLQNVNGTLFFIADDGVKGRGIWKSDGTEQGTVLVKVLQPEADPSPLLSSSIGTVIGDAYYFTNFASVYANRRQQLWRSDGTPEGTKIFFQSSVEGISADIDNVIVANGRLLFSATDGTRYGIWMSDGTAEGTTFLCEAPYRGPEKQAVLGGFSFVLNRLFFTMDDGVHGRELWSLELPPPTPHLFYNNSSFDGCTAAADALDDAAIATDKTAYLPGNGMSGLCPFRDPHLLSRQLVRQASGFLN